MNAKEVFLVVAFLLAGTLLNIGYPVVAMAYAIPVSIEFVIAAYCLVAMLVVPLRMAEIAAIGILAGILTILSNYVHIVTLISGHASWPALCMAFANLASEPAGIIVCFIAFPCLAARVRAAAPFAAAFLATIASGLTYLALLLLLPPHIPATQPGFLEAFLMRVVIAAIVNAVVVQVVFMVADQPVKRYLAGPDA
ncbi:hypothetical protein [Methanoregula sp.]|uniref:hypothetical protein n=1 Tax=Methanoregula sp. TaxID=2052170 RepID=UPI000CA873E1|nr:hypothetical protein [Methanoregula sp.]PKG31578.1 MAG: hypothetical protein CW742_12675 [Methanoregula sp.]